MKNHKIADSTGELLALVTARTRPDPKRPQRSIEDPRLDDVERRSAQCYTEMERTAYRLKKLAKALEDADISTSPVGVVEEEVNDDEELATNIQLVRLVAKPPL